MLTDTDLWRVRCYPIDSGITSLGTRSNRLGPDPDPTDHFIYRPEPVRVPGRVPGPRVSGPPWRPLVWPTKICNLCSTLLYCAKLLYLSAHLCSFCPLVVLVFSGQTAPSVVFWTQLFFWPLAVSGTQWDRAEMSIKHILFMHQLRSHHSTIWANAVLCMVCNIKELWLSD